MPNVMTMFKSALHLTASDLYDDKSDSFREAVVEIERVTPGEIVGEKGRKDGMPFVYFKGKNKPLGLNKTNTKTIIRLTGTFNHEKWIGVWLTLYVAKVDGKEGEVHAIRIRPKLAQPRTGEQKSAPPSAPANTAPEQPARELTEDEKREIERREAAEPARG